MRPSIAHVDAQTKAMSDNAEAAKCREHWRRATSNVLKTKFAEGGRVAASFKALVSYWQSLVEGFGFIKVHTLPTMR